MADQPTLAEITTNLKRWAIAESEGHPQASRWVDYYDKLLFKQQAEDEIMAELDLAKQSAALAHKLAHQTSDGFEIRAAIAQQLDISPTDFDSLLIISHTIQQVLDTQPAETSTTPTRP